MTLESAFWDAFADNGCLYRHLQIARDPGSHQQLQILARLNEKGSRRLHAQRLAAFATYVSVGLKKHTGKLFGMSHSGTLMITTTYARE